jgi:hypothetical protein
MYEAYIDFLISNRKLIEKDILIICSEWKAYKIAPFNDPRSQEELEDPRLFDFLFEKQIRVRSDVMLATMKMANQYDSELFFDHPRELAAYRAILEYWGTQKTAPKPLDDVVASAEIDISAETLTDNDLVDIRLNDAVFDEWRQSFSRALSVSSVADFQEEMRDGIRRLLVNRSPLLKGIPRNFLFGLLSGGATMLITQDPLASVGVGAGVGTGLEFVSHYLEDLGHRNQMRAQNALLSHYTALITSH